MTLMKNLFKFFRASFISSKCLIKKDFLKHVIHVMVHGYERKGNLYARKVFEGFKDLGLTSNIHQHSFFCYLCRENDI
jgi:hypothetical protein